MAIILPSQLIVTNDVKLTAEIAKELQKEDPKKEVAKAILNNDEHNKRTD